MKVDQSIVGNIISFFALLISFVALYKSRDKAKLKLSLENKDFYIENIGNKDLVNYMMKISEIVFAQKEIESIGSSEDFIISGVNENGTFYSENIVGEKIKNLISKRSIHAPFIKIGEKKLFNKFLCQRGNSNEDMIVKTEKEINDSLYEGYKYINEANSYEPTEDDFEKSMIYMDEENHNKFLNEQFQRDIEYSINSSIKRMSIQFYKSFLGIRINIYTAIYQADK